MLLASMLPASLCALLEVFSGCFTAPTFTVFCHLLAGTVAQTSRRTVCGMLVGAGLSRVWSHDRVHRFFSHARWDPVAVGLVLARLIVARLVPAGEPVRVVVDDTLFKRRGRKVFAAGWFHDGSATSQHGGNTTGFGNNWVIAGIIVDLPFMTRPVCLPVLAHLVVKDTDTDGPASRVWLATVMVHRLAAALPDKQIHAVARRRLRQPGSAPAPEQCHLDDTDAAQRRAV